jgi:hypothetical protein|tara:strand:- start:747 stop:1007 length:261 start_codon:yes stop_codon:yes gene_type:complete
MKWVLIDKFDNIVHTVDLSGRYTQEEARKYFVNLKQIPYENFIQLWKVYSIEEWKNIQHAYQRPPSSSPNRDWWKDEESYLDLEKL